MDKVKHLKFYNRLTGDYFAQGYINKHNIVLSGIYKAQTKLIYRRGVVKGAMVMMAGKKKLHYPHFYVGCRGDADISCRLSLGYRILL